MAETPAKSDGRSYLGVIASQALGSFNDNFFKQFLICFAVGVAASQASEKVELGNLTTLVFIAPFILFSFHAGWLADRFSKRTVLLALKGAEVCLMLATALAFHAGSFPVMVAMLFLITTLAALGSPAKYGILPELLLPADLARGNGLLELTNFVAIVLGNVAGSVAFRALREGLYRGGLIMTGIALVGWVLVLAVRRVPPAAPERRFPGSPWPELRQGVSIVWPDRTLRLTALGVAYFWSLALMLQTNLYYYCDAVWQGEQGRIGFLVGAVALGIGCGSALAGLFSRRKVELGLVPIGALGMASFSVLLFWTWRLPGENAYIWTIADLALLGAFGGFFIVPLQTLLQQEAPADKKGTVLALVNFAAFTGMLSTLGVLHTLLNVFGFSPAQVFLIAGGATILGTFYVLTLLPQQMFRLIFWLVTNTIYRVRVVGGENIPLHGPALLVANHVSFVDGLLVLASTHRFIRFIVYKGIAYLPGLRALSRVMRVIPIAAEEGPRAILTALKDASKALEAGELVCIFAEGEISRTGQMLPFRAGTERILKGFPATIIPVHLDQVWGSIFSFAGGRFFWKWPLRVPYPVTVSFGKPLPADTPIETVRQAVQELGSAAFELRKRREKPLPWAFVRYARRHPFALSMVDSLGRRASFGKLLASTAHLARILRSVFREQENAAFLLPPSVGGAAANLAASLLGKPVVNLNYTSSAEGLRSALEQTGTRTVVTSRAFLEKLQLQLPAELVFLEDLAGKHGRLLKCCDALAAWLLPAPLLRRWMGARKIGLDDVVTIIFSSGSTGEPKGVLLSHFNVLSNIQSVAQLLQLGPRDRILGVLPFFHSTGYTGGLWSPLLTGMVAVYHMNPLDARIVGQLVKQHGVTILFATPTFIQGYARRCEPEDFGSLIYVIVGAEKLTPQVAQLFRERFGVEPMEGYGCTEASPMIAVNVPDFRGRGIYQVGGKKGTVGHPLPGVHVRIVDPDTGAELPVGKPGMLLAKGPNIMKGYLGKPELTAEVLRDGWYSTGDVAFIDEDGFITITDRLSRFSKIGGEMVPHVKVEEALNAALELVEQELFVTSIADEKKGERLAVVHTLNDERLRQLLDKLPAQGLPNLWTPRQDAFVRVEQIPRLGTGKVDLRALRKLAAEALATATQATASP